MEMNSVLNTELSAMGNKSIIMFWCGEYRDSILGETEISIGIKIQIRAMEDGSNPDFSSLS